MARKRLLQTRKARMARARYRRQKGRGFATRRGRGRGRGKKGGWIGTALSIGLPLLSSLLSKD